MAIDCLLVAMGPDDSDHVDDLVRVTTDIATPSTTTVLLSYVFPQDDYDDLVDEMNVDQTQGDVKAEELAGRLASVKTAMEQLDEASIAYEVRGAIGDKQVDEILHITATDNADHVVVGGSPRSPTGKAVFGDRAQQVLLNAPCPVTYVSSE